jgi:putative hydrolase of the HAD superfamily
MNLVFDFGAVLFRWRPLEMVALSFPERASTPQNAGHLAHQIFGHADWHDFDRGSLDMDAVIERTAGRLQLDRSVLGELVQNIGENLQPIEESLALLTRLHAMRTLPQSDLRLYFLSNMPVPYARALERRYAFLGWFDGGVFSGDVLSIKPELLIYQLLQQRYGLHASQTVFVDDLLGNVESARALGWRGIHFTGAHQLESELRSLGLVLAA